MIPDKVLKWLRHQSKDFCAADFDALVKRRDVCINVGGGYVEKLMFFQVRISHVLRFISICDRLLTLPRNDNGVFAFVFAKLLCVTACRCVSAFMFFSMLALSVLI
jgi:hypothetical protein